MEQSLSYQARRELLQQTASQYRQASPSQKRALLEAFIATTGYVRKYTMWLLNHAKEVQQRSACTSSVEQQNGFSGLYVVYWYNDPTWWSCSNKTPKGSSMY